MTPEFTSPQVFLISYTVPRLENLIDFLDTINSRDAIYDPAVNSEPLIALTSIAAKTCYDSLVVGNNKNVTRIRPMTENFEECIKHGHGSVLEHCSVTFAIAHVSRVCTHELVRHRVGTAFSQTSGRYVRSNSPTFFPGDGDGIPGFRDAVTELYRQYAALDSSIDWSSMDMQRRKEVSSALRRLLPNGDSSNLILTTNFRALRHIIQMRTSPHAEEEIRIVAYQMYLLSRELWPRLFFDATITDHPSGPPSVTFQHRT